MRNFVFNSVNKKVAPVAILLWAGLLLFTPGWVEGAYEISWHTIDGGGGVAEQGYTMLYGKCQ